MKNLPSDRSVFSDIKNVMKKRCQVIPDKNNSDS